MEIRVSGLVPESIVDGKGIRFVVFTQGCPHGCLNCHNPETHDVSGGKLKDINGIFAEFIKDPILKGITFSGGEPFMQPEPLTALAKLVHKTGKDVTCYSGYTYEELVSMGDSSVNELLKECDILIDGRFEESLKNLELRFRGSENQRVIDVEKSLNAGFAVLVPDIDS